MKGLCTNCPHGKTRATCTELCPEAEAYASQDHVSRDELPLDDFNADFRATHEFERTDPRDIMKARAKDLHKRGFKYREIANTLGLGSVSVAWALVND